MYDYIVNNTEKKANKDKSLKVDDTVSGNESKKDVSLSDDLNQKEDDWGDFEETDGTIDINCFD